MQVTLSIIRYPKRFIYFALLAMAVHRLPLWLNKKITFYKLMGSGKNGSFDKHPDWQQWGILAVYPDIGATPSDEDLPAFLYGKFIAKWFRLFNCEIWTVFLVPQEGHGSWDGQQPFGGLARGNGFDGPVAVLTRASIRISKLRAFWQNVDGVATLMRSAPGFIISFGIGEIPFLKQATFSIWQSSEAMKQFAYSQPGHREVIKKTRQEQWYSEDMFVRFRPLKTAGTIRGKDPLEGMFYI